MKTHKNCKFTGFFPDSDSLDINQTQTNSYNRIENYDSRLDENHKEYINIVNNKNEITIVDLGGGAGGHYKTLKENVTDKKITYKIIESPGIIKNLTKKLRDYPEVTCYSSIEELSGCSVDLVYTNATLQMLSPNKPSKVAEQLFNLKPEKVLIQRIIVAQGDVSGEFFTEGLIDHSELPKQYFCVTTDKIMVDVGFGCGYDLEYSEHERPEPTQFIIDNQDYLVDGKNKPSELFYRNFLFKKQT